ncbi:MAG TPA: GGDEF domain-containing protein, partial [Deinococcales bacterium]|nr:GGDEF domain-containing protein [Deinococcales bacterium]
FLDVALMAASGFALAWHFVIDPYSQSLVPGMLPGSIVDVSPYVQVSLFALAAQVLLQRTSRLPSRLFGIAILLIMFADALLAMVVKDAMRLNTGITALWTTGTALLALDAGRAPLPPEGRRVNLFGVQRPDRVPGLRILPYVVGGSSVAVITFHVHLPWADTLARQQGFMLSTVVLALLVLRQMLMLLENQRLGRQLIAANRELHHKATHDDLTGLLNHAGFNTKFEAVLNTATREHRQLALFVFDFDSFKQVNDEHGHMTGDELLRAAGRRIRSGLVEGQHAARLGGDEFLLLLPVSGAAAAEQHTHELAERLMQPYRLSQSDLTLDAGVSIGFSIFPDDGTDIASLLRAADRAMYRNKRRRTRVNS